MVETDFQVIADAAQKLADRTAVMANKLGSSQGQGYFEKQFPSESGRVTAEAILLARKSPEYEQDFYAAAQLIYDALATSDNIQMKAELLTEEAEQRFRAIVDDAKNHIGIYGNTTGQRFPHIIRGLNMKATTGRYGMANTLVSDIPSMIQRIFDDLDDNGSYDHADLVELSKHVSNLPATPLQDGSGYDTDAILGDVKEWQKGVKELYEMVRDDLALDDDWMRPKLDAKGVKIIRQALQKLLDAIFAIQHKIPMVEVREDKSIRAAESEQWTYKPFKFHVGQEVFVRKSKRYGKIVRAYRDASKELYDVKLMNGMVRTYSVGFIGKVARAKTADVPTQKAASTKRKHFHADLTPENLAQMADGNFTSGEVGQAYSMLLKDLLLSMRLSISNSGGTNRGAVYWKLSFMYPDKKFDDMLILAVVEPFQHMPQASAVEINGESKHVNPGYSTEAKTGDKDEIDRILTDGLQKILCDYAFYRDQVIA